MPGRRRPGDAALREAEGRAEFADIQLVRKVVDLERDGLSSCVLRALSQTDKLADATDLEDRVYRLLADTFPTTGATAVMLVEAAKCNRTHIYEVLNALLSKGLVRKEGAHHWKVVPGVQP